MKTSLKSLFILILTFMVIGGTRIADRKWTEYKIPMHVKFERELREANKDLPKRGDAFTTILDVGGNYHNKELVYTFSVINDYAIAMVENPDAIQEIKNMLCTNLPEKHADFMELYKLKVMKLIYLDQEMRHVMTIDIDCF